MGMRFERNISPGGGEKGVVRRFGRREDGSATVFTLFLISVLLMVTGYAIDAARFESNRIRLQGTLDRAVLAAASVTQSMRCRDVVEDYFKKADMAGMVDKIHCDVLGTRRSATASASLEMDTMFMEGLDTLVAPASGAATESIMDIEIVLVLDVTGSMKFRRIEPMREAAQAFTDKVLGADKNNRVSIAVVPYNEQVHLDPWLLNKLPGVTAKLGYDTNGCIDLPSSVWSTPGIDPATPMPQQPEIIFVGMSPSDRVDKEGGVLEYVTPKPPVRPITRDPNNFRSYELNCLALPTEDYLRVKLPSQHIGDIKAGLGALQPNGDTSMHLGMKWGVTMIDPLMRPIYTEAIKDGLMPATLAGRPYDYDRKDTMKVVVLMTDGWNTSSSYVNEGYHSGPSGIYRGSDGQYAIHHPSRPGPNNYFVPHLGPGSDVGATVPGWKATPSWPGSGTVTELDWVDVWKQLTAEWMINQLYARPLSDNDPTRRPAVWWAQYVAMISETDDATMDSQLLATCSKVKDLDVLVFTIAFHAPAQAKTLLRDCASGAPYYYEPTGGDIKNAFDSIANTINVLRLTQ